MGSTRNARGCSARHLKLIRPGRSCGGFTYIGVLLAVAFIGVALAATGTVWQQTRQREKERELLFVGNQFRQALEGYYENPPPGKARKFPQKIEDLLQDDRRPDIRRYLRVIYRDPMTGSTEWGLLRGADQGIVGLYSLSDGEPIKTANFDPEYAELAGKRHYYEWRFIAKAGVIAATGGVASNATVSDAVVPPPGPSDAVNQTEAEPQVEAQQSIPVVEPTPPQQQNSVPEWPRITECQNAFSAAIAGCRGAGRGCIQAARAQYVQCYK
ncbi:type II secretion system protein [Sulfuricella sp. T08]|uniref:type II secretion system protein n=1 Tax=Sulfuricella sp. T08 TaxID=1632857 RepID=UPI001186BDE3|nr:type II secretion system protein [Sulfuricella sp. T08]